MYSFCEKILKMSYMYHSSAGSQFGTRRSRIMVREAV